MLTFKSCPERTGQQLCQCSIFFAVRTKKLMGIKKFHHLHFDSAKPGKVVVKVHSASAETRYELLKQPWTPDLLTLPQTKFLNVSSGTYTKKFIHSVPLNLSPWNSSYNTSSS